MKARYLLRQTGCMRVETAQYKHRKEAMYVIFIDSDTAVDDLE